MHAHHQLGVHLNRLLLEDSGLTGADYEILAVLSEHPGERMPAQELCSQLQWEKSRLSHQVRRMHQQGLIAREPNPADGRSAMIVLLPRGRRAIEDAAPEHVHNVRRNFIDLLTPAELDILAALNERVLRHLAAEPSPGQPCGLEQRRISDHDPRLRLRRWWPLSAPPDRRGWRVPHHKIVTGYFALIDARRREGTGGPSEFPGG